MIREPVAAALAYGLDLEEEQVLRGRAAVGGGVVALKVA